MITQALPLLRCPRCEQSLREESGDLRCPSGHRFPVRDGIPRFTPDSTYADNFGFEWTRFPRTQLDDDTRGESENAFRVKTGLRPEDVAGKSVLDAGCGMGRFSDVVLRWGAGRAVGVDIGRAVEAAAANLAHHPSASFVQADLRHLPLEPASFDIVFSIGVLHHTPNTRDAFLRVAEMVKPGGTYCVWVYSRALRWRLAGGEVWRLATRRMRQETLLRLVERAVPRVDALRRWMPSPARRALNVLVPVSHHPDPTWRILDTFDWYSPRYQWKHTYEQVEGWFASLGYEEIRRHDFPVAVSGRRPETAERTGSPGSIRRSSHPASANRFQA